MMNNLKTLMLMALLGALVGASLLHQRWMMKMQAFCGK